MEILNRTISAKTEADVKKITESFSKETEYFDMGLTPLKGFGAVYHDNPEIYEVYLRDITDETAFETNLICELIHIQLAEGGFPNSGIKNSETVKKEQNVAFFQYLNHSLRSAVLDMVTFNRLKEMGYDYSFFTDYKLGLIKEVNESTNMADKYNQASFAVQFLLFMLTAKEEQVKEATEFIDSIFDGAATKLMPMAEEIKKIGLDSAEKAARVMSYIADEYKLWDVFYIEYNVEKIRTHGSYVKYFGLE